MDRKCSSRGTQVISDRLGWGGCRCLAGIHESSELKRILLKERKKPKQSPHCEHKRAQVSNLNEAEPSHRAAPSPLPRDANSRLQPSLQPTFDPSCSPSTDMVRKQEVSQDGLTSRSSHFRPADGIAASPLGQPTLPILVITLSSLLWPCKSELAPGAALPIAYIHQWRASAGIGNPSGGDFFSFLSLIRESLVMPLPTQGRTGSGGACPVGPNRK